MSELKPCPFCGGTDIAVEQSQGVWSVSCISKRCPVNPDLWFGGSKGKAVEGWNTRPVSVNRERELVERIQEVVPTLSHYVCTCGESAKCPRCDAKDVLTDCLIALSDSTNVSIPLEFAMKLLSGCEAMGWTQDAETLSTAIDAMKGNPKWSDGMEQACQDAERIHKGDSSRVAVSNDVFTDIASTLHAIATTPGNAAHKVMAEEAYQKMRVINEIAALQEHADG